MSKRTVLFALALSLGAFGRAADIGVVFMNAAAVTEGRGIVGAASGGGVLVPSKSVMAADQSKILAGIPGGRLTNASLSRMDNELEAAFIKFGEPVTDPALQMAFQRYAARLVDFLPKDNPLTTNAYNGGSAPVAYTGDPYEIRIGKQVVSDSGVTLKKRGKLSNFDLEVKRLTPGGSIWKISMTLSSEPEVFFWNRRKQRTLTEVPAKVLTYSQQVMFAPMSEGKSFKIPVEASSLKEDAYTWTIRIETKEGVYEKKFPVAFEKK